MALVAALAGVRLVLVPVALSFVVASGLFLAGLGMASLLQPDLARRFLLGFVGSAAKHYVELVIRGAVGLAFIVAAPRLPWSPLYLVAGWVLLATTVALVVMPWRQHQRFARWSVPRAMACLPLIGAASLMLGGAVLASAYAAIAG